MPTETDYAALDDRALDALVAERLFDYEIDCLHREIEHLDGSLMMCKECGERFGQTTLAMARSRWPAYHADIKDAWKLVEAMLERGFHLSMNSYGGLPWWVEFATLDKEKGAQAFHEAEPARLICIAALRALDEETP